MEKKNNGNLGGKYPAQIYSTGRPNVILSLEFHLGLPPEDQPALTMHAGWSRYVTAIVDKRKGEPFVVSANIPVADASLIAHKVKAIFDHKFFNRGSIIAKMNKAKKDAAGDKNALAFSDTFKFGNLKGRTPGEIILSGGKTGADDIAKQKSFLEANLSKYPANQSLVDACAAALECYSNGTLKNTGSSELSLEKEVYKTPIKYLASKKNNEGKYFVYQVTITCDYAKDSAPWTVAIMNGWANVTINDDKTVNITDKVSGMTSSSFNLSDEEMFAYVDRLERSLQAFELSNWRTQYKNYDLAVNAYRNNSGT